MGGAPLGRFGGTMNGQVLLFVFLFALDAVYGQASYSIPEEMTRGALVGNIAQDLGLEIQRLISGKAKIYSRNNEEYIELSREKGVLLVKERIDREALCAHTALCALHFRIILESPIEFYSVTVQITDINDNAPSFEKKEMKFKISESATIGAKFVLDGAIDLDVGINDLQNYELKPADHFALKLQNNADGNKNVEMTLQKPLDREKEEQMSLVLTAVDGGEPRMSGTMLILITVLDANDNAPVFTQQTYKAIVTENSPLGTIVATVAATDADGALNSKLVYSITNTHDNVRNIFDINKETGQVSLIGNINYEHSKYFQIKLLASDVGGLTDSSKLIIDVQDINDNKPEITIMSKSNVILEDAELNTVVTVINIEDLDSGDNGMVKCYINENIPFALKTSENNFYSLITDSELDREKSNEYNITVTCSDEGVPSLSSSVTLTLHISDVNDNAPVFERSSYEAYIVENNTPGLSVFTVKASDDDWNQNARLSYILEDSSVNGVPVSSYVSVSAESGVIHAVRSFDYEQLKEFHFRVRAQDGGSPPLSSNVSVRMVIQDQNDNAPQVLYPVQTGGSVLAEMVPRSADVGYLVTKVVAVDVDCGQNAWLSYKVHKATDRALFEVGLHNGEIRTVRQVTDKDAVKQRLTVVVEDNGQPSRSATVIVNVAVADSFPQVLSEFTDFSMHDKEYNDKLTFYLVLALAVVSFLFITCLLLIISVKVYRWRQSRVLCHSNLPVIPYYPPRYSDTLGTGTLPHVYNYEVCRTTDSRKSDCKLDSTASHNVMTMDSSFTATMQKLHSEKNILDEPDSPLEQKPPNNDWRFNQGARPGPSGPHMPYGTHIRWTPKSGTRAAGGPEVAMGTGPWPQPPTEAEQLQALMAAANVSEATGTLGPGTMGLSTRYSPQFTLQHVPDYRQNVYIPGSTATLTSNPQQQQQQAMAQQAGQQALPPPQPGQPEPPKAAQTPASKKKSTKKEKK
ncbi:protocadherin gamma-A10-like isoform X12 [Festucalex cinctus]